MKKIVKYIPLLAIPMVLSSCAFIKNLIPGGKSNTTSGDSTTTTSQTTQSGGTTSGATPSGSWSSEVQAEMRQYVGEVLPYAAFDEATLYHEYVTDYYDDYGYNVYVVGDSSSTDTGALNGYADRLLAAGYTATDYDGEIYYAKTTSVGDIEVTFDYFTATEDYDAGYEIDVYIMGDGGDSGEGGDDTGGDEGGDDDTPVTGGEKLTQETFGIEAGSTTYATYTYTGASGAKYTAAAAGATGIQIRAKDGKPASGVIGYLASGACKSITFAINSATFGFERKLQIFGASSEFTMDKMFDDSMTAITEITLESSKATFTYTFTTNYSCVGFRSANGAIYFDSLTFVW